MSTGSVLRGLAGLSFLLGILVMFPAEAAPYRGMVEVTRAPAASAIAGQYIVRLKPGVGTSDVIVPLGVTPLYSYQLVASGFAVRLTPAELTKVRLSPQVIAIEEDALAEAFDPQEGMAGSSGSPPPAVPDYSWGLDRLNQRRLPLDHVFKPAHHGTGVTAYILDSGIEAGHSEFTGRIVPGYSVIQDGKGTADCLGHGTQVAGIVGGTTWGVATGVKLVPVRVLGCDGSGTYSGIIAGLDWIAANAVKPAVANLSFGGSKSAATNAAVTELADAGVFVAAAAGNSRADACNVSPAGAPRVLAVGATTYRDALASFSNVGPCVDMLAPGYAVVSARKGGGGKIGDGTSFAAPYATGIAALYKEKYGDKPVATIVKWMIDEAETDVLTGVPATTHNRLLSIDGL
ncbi:S8 family peptidase [Sphaerisporangium corydalis]|uniref:S8 family peptidase n=1 Tax=Sphaerisporangium corydalis TaxID=1441875 RepID=A0ABV9E909_9ACTN|nr:S8 family peptidase [Sphaerisporangium corydalis]